MSITSGKIVLFRDMKFAIMTGWFAGVARVSGTQLNDSEEKQSCTVLRILFLILFSFYS